MEARPTQVLNWYRSNKRLKGCPMPRYLTPKVVRLITFVEGTLTGNTGPG
jgi:hypothetical protein